MILFQRTGYLLAFIVNLASLALVVALAWLLEEIQTFVGILVALIAAAGSFFFWEKT